VAAAASRRKTTSHASTAENKARLNPNATYTQNTIMKQITGGNDKIMETNVVLAKHGISARGILF
jgi:hypothetical protein